VIDEGYREALRNECGTSIPASRMVRVMDQLFEVYGKPEAICLDNGPELTAEVFVNWAERHGVKLLFIQPGKPNQNAFIERFNRSFRQEVLDAWLFNAVREVQSAADDWLIPTTTNIGPTIPWAACRQRSREPTSGCLISTGGWYGTRSHCISGKRCHGRPSTRASNCPRLSFRLWGVDVAEQRCGWGFLGGV